MVKKLKTFNSANMEKRLFLIIQVFLLSCIILATGLQAQNIPAIVSTDWLEENMANPNLVLLDVRAPGNYAAGHIPGSINVPAYPNWYINNPGEQPPWMELPKDESLYATLGEAGISANSTVIVIARTTDSETEGLAEYGMTKASRAAITLIYAGVEKVVFLNGGYDKWHAEEKAISTQPTLPEAITYDGKAIDNIFVTKKYVEKKIGQSTILDTRDSDNYFGLGTDYSSKRPGHIPTAILLPAPWFWQHAKTDDGEVTFLMWKDTDEIKEIALTVLGEKMENEIIDYCGVGGYASPVWFVLTQLVGYTNVKFYDGSMQEWTSDPEAPVTKYKYQ
jgi:thiosulfate/3-mercaptopyruvate sulfurtransferase